MRIELRLVVTKLYTCLCCRSLYFVTSASISLLKLFQKSPNTFFVCLIMSMALSVYGSYPNISLMSSSILDAGGDRHRKNKHFASSNHRRADPL